MSGAVDVSNMSERELRKLESSWRRTQDLRNAWEAHEYIEGSGDLDFGYSEFKIWTPKRPRVKPQPLGLASLVKEDPWGTTPHKNLEDPPPGVSAEELRSTAMRLGSRAGFRSST